VTQRRSRRMDLIAAAVYGCVAACGGPAPAALPPPTPPVAVTPAPNRAAINPRLLRRFRPIAQTQTTPPPSNPISCQIGELNQAFLNIIVNAAHAIAGFIKEGERGRIRVVTRQEGGDAIVEISDTGGGIPEAIRPRIFDPFFTTKGVGRGTGQGLAIARRSVIERHGGTLTFETTMGQGTTFVIRIPNQASGASDVVAA
jgi:signal transduction histidine kinase